MSAWAKPANQARGVMQQLQGDIVQSVRSVSNYEQALTRVAEWLRDEHRAGREGGALRDLTPERATQYLEQRGEDVGQKALDQERQAIQLMQRHVSNQLTEDGRLPVIRSELTQTLESRQLHSRAGRRRGGPSTRRQPPRHRSRLCRRPARPRAADVAPH